MYNGSTELNTAIAGQSRTFSARITAGETVITSGIKSIKWMGGGNAGGTLTIGSTVAARVEVEMAAPGVLLENKEISVEVGVRMESGVEYIPMGRFTVEKPEKSAGNIRFSAHDRMISKGELAYFSGLIYPSDSLKVLEEICGKMGITLATAGLKAIAIPAKPEGYTCREVLGYIAGMNGKFAVINRTGQLELRWYEAAGTVDFDRADEPEVAEYDFTVGKITCAVDKETTLTAGSGPTGIQCSNPLMTQTVLDTAYKGLDGFSYRPGTVSLRLGDPRIDPWDMLQVTRDGEAYLLPCMALTHDFDGGIITEVTAAGESQTEAEYNYQGPTAQRLDRVYTELLMVRDLVADSVTVEYLKANYATIQDLTAVSAKVGNLEADVAKIGELTANMVTTEYLEANYAQIDLANIKEGCITTAMIGTGVIGTTQIADGSITDAKIVGLTANKITAGTLDAAEIDVVNLNCANLTVGTINGQQIAPGAVDMDKLGQDAAGAITGAASDAAQALEDAAAAFQAAQNATTAAGAAQASADGKNTVYYQEGLPPPYGHKINDVCFDTSEDNCIFYWAGESWTQVQFGTNAIANASITNALIADATIQSAKIAFLDAAKITTGTLSAGRIAANSITADKIAVGDFTNYATISEAIPESEIINNHPFGSRGSIIKAGYVVKQMPGYTYLPLTQYRTNAFEDGDELYFSLSIRGDTSGSFRFCVRFYGDGSADDKTYKTYFAVSGLSYTGTEQTCTGSIKLGTCRSYSYYVIVLEDANSALGQIYVRNIQVRKKSQGALIVDGAITAVKIAANAITADKISSNAITAVKIAANTITGDKIAASTITAKNLAADCITSDKIVADAITTGKIAARAVTANEIAANAISAEKIAAGAISTDKLAAGAVTAGKINVTSLQAISANIGGFQIGGSYIAKGTTSLAGAANSVYLGTNGISCGTAFKVTSAGALTCTDGSFTGTVKSSNATITGGTINITTVSETISVIMINYGNYSNQMSPYRSVYKYGNAATLVQANAIYLYKVFNSNGSGTPSVYLTNEGTVCAGLFETTIGGMVKSRIIKSPSNTPSEAVQVHTNYALYVKNYAGTDPQEIIAGKYTTASSERFKDNISPYLENALDLIRRSPVYSYNRKIDLEKGISKKEIGFVIERGAPDCIVNETRDAVNMYSISGILWKGMQEIDSRMAMSESREIQLEQRVEYLQQQLTKAYTLMAVHGIKEDVQ